METTHYNIAKLLQIPALLSQHNQFSAVVISINSETANCDPHQQQLIDAAIETHNDIDQLTEQ